MLSLLNSGFSLSYNKLNEIELKSSIDVFGESIILCDNDTGSFQGYDGLCNIEDIEDETCYSFEEAFTSVATTMNNVGPGLGRLNGGFSFFSWHSKLVFIFNMLAGRLEVIPMLVLFFPKTWKKN